MEKIYKVNWDEVKEQIIQFESFMRDHNYRKVYGIPKGGMIATAYLSKDFEIVCYADEAEVLLDDIKDSGETLSKYLKNTVYPLFDKKKDFPGYDWIMMPWESQHPNGQDTVEQNIVRLLQFIGEDPKREGILATPDRVIRSFKELYGGYNQDVKDIFTYFDAGTYNQMVVVKDIEIYSMCEHHMLPIIGKAHIGYIPDKKIIGLSKLARLVDLYSRRLQVQERIGDQVVDALMKYLKPKGAMCVIEADHMCMQMRGVNKQDSSTTTSSIRGVFEKQKTKNEFLKLIK